MKAALGLCLFVALLVSGGCISLGAAPDARPGDPTEADAAPVPAVDYYTLTAMANDLAVAAADSGAGPLVADRASVGEGGQFEVIDNPDGTISLRAKVNQLYVTADLVQETRLRAGSATNGTSESFRKLEQPDGTFALQALANDLYVSADLDEGAVLFANRQAVAGAWEKFVFTKVTPPSSAAPDFGPTVLLFDPSMSAASIQGQLDGVFAQMESNHFGPERYALVFKPGTYDVDVNVGFYTQVLGLGLLPDQVTINGSVHAEADWFNGNATQNFWRAVENLAVVPKFGLNRWAVSQASPFRRVHIVGSLVLDDGGWSSGGFIADSLIDGEVNSGSQQQWFSRNSEWGAWAGSNWNTVFTGNASAPSGNSWPNPPYTVVERTPVVREKPFLFVDAVGDFNVFVPALREDSQGTTWAGGSPAGETLPIGKFHIARQDRDTAATLNGALTDGKDLLFTPGIYHLDDTLRVTRADTVILGMGLATLIAENGVDAMAIADVDGVKVAGLLFDAGETSSDILLEVGPTGSSADHAANPTSLHDVFFRVGGAAVGRAAVSVKLNSSDVIGDHFWIWRADHTHGVGWNTNTTSNGLIVNGNDVTIYGLFVEHYHQYQTLWNGNGGRVYFYQSEIPYDVPSQGAWMNGSTNGFASYKVASTVTSHEAWGLGIYCFFSANSSVRLASAIEAPSAPGVKFHHIVTVSLGGRGEITHLVNAIGAAANAADTVAHLNQFP